ncbi:hypothetical protein C4J86_2343 [Pseudomonas sp. R2-7-07]|nr:hypothetical protein C4J86_2343 [Pseudomonas sp. R2-7-07]
MGASTADACDGWMTVGAGRISSRQRAMKIKMWEGACSR